MAAQENFLKSLTERDFISRVSQFPNDFVNPDIGLTGSRSAAGAGYPDVVTREINDSDFLPVASPDVAKAKRKRASSKKRRKVKKGGVSKKGGRKAPKGKKRSSSSKRKGGRRKLKRVYKKRRNCKKSTHFHKIKSTFI